MEAGKSPTIVAAPFVEGYEFIGWSDYSFVSVTKDLNVYAQYIKRGNDYQGVTVSGKEGNYTYVDLGLKNGTKWATYNVGANKPTEYGDEFAWGETKSKNVFDWGSYKWSEGKEVDMAGYPKITKYNTVDNKKVLDAEDDAATANWGSGWRMPTWEEFQELFEGCDWEWTEDFNGTGVAGVIGTSATNGNTIFLPAASSRGDTDLSDAGYSGSYWSSSVGGLSMSSSVAHSFDFYFSSYLFEFYLYDGNGVCYGQSVRAVVK